MPKNQSGWFTDHLSQDEVDFSKNAAEQLREAPWTKKMLKESKIKGALSVQPSVQRTYNELNEIKSALFEVRFAFAIHLEHLTAEYEYPTGVDNSSIDFKVRDENNSWLIELTSLRESDAVKTATTLNNNSSIIYESITGKDENSPEILDILKLQNAIYNKVTKKNSKLKPIKFPKITNKNYHVIVIDARSINVSAVDYFDFALAINGSLSLSAINQGFYCRFFFNKNTKELSHIRGVFEENNEDGRSVIVRERIHFIGFTVEKSYSPGELMQEMIVFPNPRYFSNWRDIESIWPFQNRLINTFANRA